VQEIRAKLRAKMQEYQASGKLGSWMDQLARRATVCSRSCSPPRAKNLAAVTTRWPKSSDPRTGNQLAATV
jgi:hypothetical protein